jgi:predicted Zn-dependent peptidase
MLSSAIRTARFTRSRGFATAVESSFKVAAIDAGQPSSAVTVLVKAGSRYETKPGVAHVLKNFAFKVRRELVHLKCVTLAHYNLPFILEHFQAFFSPDSS